MCGAVAGASEDWPDTLIANAWTGAAAAAGRLGEEAREWAAGDHFAAHRRAKLAAEDEPILTDWADRRVGWGLLLRDDPNLKNPERARADDAPAAIRRLATFRSASGEPLVIRYEPGDLDHLYRYTATGRRTKLPLTGDGPRGTLEGQLPRYLLIVGSPEEIPWDLQFALNAVCFTGRLDLDDAGLENYVTAATGSWAGSAVDATRPLLWSVEHEPKDITWLMRQTVGVRVFAKWDGDRQMRGRARVLRRADATCAGLVAGLAEDRPGVVVTTSHGMTGPTSDPVGMRATLGWLVDAGHTALDPARVLADWEPDGVVWYALACCSAGGSGRNQFDRLLDPEGDAGRIVQAVADLGPVTASFPRSLLGAGRPARAFIGHVEPTFNWTLRRADTGLVTTQSLVDALYDELFRATPPPVGYAMRHWYQGALTLRGRWRTGTEGVPRARDLPSVALLTSLAGIDRQCTVILGDPAVAPAALPPTRA